MSEFSGQVGIITGAGHGIGRATATLLAGDGAKVVVAEIQEEWGQAVVQEITDAGGEAIFIHTDVGDHAAIQRAVEETVNHWGRLDFVVNNAYWSARGTVEEVSEADWDRSMDIMLKAIYLFGKYAFPVMKQQGGGAMVNLASIHGYAAAHRYGIYAAAKAGVINLTRAMAIDYGHDGIRVNAICPGPVQGPRIDGVIAARAAAQGERFETTRDSYLRQNSLHTFIQAQDIADLVVFLCSPAGRKISGQALAIDGNTETLRV